MEKENKLKLTPIYESSFIEDDIDEQKEIAKGLKAGATELEMISKLATFFKVDVGSVKLALAKDATTLTKELERAIAQDFK